MSVIQPLVRLTPRGDATRIWFSVVATLLILAPIILAAGGSFQSAYLLLATDLLYGLFLALTWVAICLSTAEDVQSWAKAQEPQRSQRKFLEFVSGRKFSSGATWLSFITSVSAGGLGLALTLLPQTGGLGTEPLRALLCVLGVLLSWGLLHTSYALFYARLYYREPSEPSGLEFPGVGEPAALDFAYFAFTVGTAFATSDVSITAANIRRVVLGHGILAFFYNTTILALVVNFIASS